MSRVNDAIARAAAGGADVARPATPNVAPAPSAFLPSENGADTWPAESPAAEPDADLDLRGNYEGRQEQFPELQTRWTDPAEGFGGKLVMGRAAEPVSTEQYRRLGARLYLAQAERGTRVVMVTSALVGEGKTLTAANLALTLSESYKKRVLLIDADLRRPWMHEMFRLPNITGLNDGIRADTERKVPLMRVTDHLSVLTAGRPDPDPMSVLSSDRMRRVVEDASAAFDWVIIDTPPVALLSDARVLASLVDTVVLVVRAGATPLSAIKAATEAVGRDRIFGVVLNCADGAVPAVNYGYYGARELEIAKTS